MQMKWSQVNKIKKQTKNLFVLSKLTPLSLFLIEDATTIADIQRSLITNQYVKQESNMSLSSLSSSFDDTVTSSDQIPQHKSKKK